MEQNIQLKQIEEIINETVDKEIKELIDNVLQETPKNKGRPKKYLNTEEAKEKAKEQRKQFKQRQRQKVVLFRKDVTAKQLDIAKMINKYILDDDDIDSMMTILDNLPQNCLSFVRIPLERSIRKVLSIEISVNWPSLLKTNVGSKLLVSQATKADPEIELRFLLRQFNRRLRMDQLKEIIEIAKEDNQQAALKLMEYLNK
ncbi:MAG: hypothetical protein EZS28_001874 [Streblomastix strix]|uniref:Uncharacterized protein n=1 Tax=Streblomastix strix TaxID=222440 RepID=A0A5J4X7J6_9EUKA|nr:MAG: hypothetical protein EZS28_001874 [Streblomastix strix]